MKRHSIAVGLLAICSVIAGHLLAGISFVGKAGVTLMYTEYKFFKTWWKGALVVFIAWMIFYIFQTVVQKRLSKSVSTVVHVVLLLVAAAGLFLSYSDFHNTLSHRWLGQQFHFGVYLFWLVWMGISIFLLIQKKRPVFRDENVRKTALNG